MVPNPSLVWHCHSCSAGSRGSGQAEGCSCCTGAGEWLQHRHEERMWVFLCSQGQTLCCSLGSAEPQLP